MPKLKPDTILPTDEEDHVITAAAMADEDAQPMSDGEWEAIRPMLRGGRPRKVRPKEQIALRVDADVLAWYRAQGAGWQSRMNAVLKAFRDASL